MLKVNKESKFLELIWRCDKCGGQEVLARNQSESFVAVSFDPPTIMSCCGNTEEIGHIEAVVNDDGTVEISK